MKYEMVKVEQTYESAWGLEDKYHLICLVTGRKLLKSVSINKIRNYIWDNDLVVVEGVEYI